VYRDVETLRAAGVPIESPEYGWHNVPENWVPPGTVDVRDEEVTALCVARQLAPGLKDTAIGRALETLWSKLSAPGRQPRLSLGDEAWFHTGGRAPLDYSRHQVVLDAVREAVRSRRTLRIRYRKSDGEDSTRTIEPALVHWDVAEQALYVYAWCREREASRVFAVHRIAHAELTDELFAPRRDAVTQMRNAFRLWPRTTPEPVVLRFSPRVAGEVRERRWHPTARLTDIDDGGVVLEMEVGAPEELERWLLGYGPDVAVEAPVALAERIRERHAEAAAPARFGTLRARSTEPAPAVAAAPRARSKR
jgi:predicted DNA-binding transcriptional regulator YafY